jgi:hypothetical protein
VLCQDSIKSTLHPYLTRIIRTIAISRKIGSLAIYKFHGIVTSLNHPRRHCRCAAIRSSKFLNRQKLDRSRRKLQPNFFRSAKPPKGILLTFPFACLTPDAAPYTIVSEDNGCQTEDNMQPLEDAHRGRASPRVSFSRSWTPVHVHRRPAGATSLYHRGDRYGLQAFAIVVAFN